MRLYKTNKIVYSFKNKPQEFIQGLASNTVAAPRNAFLDIHGKIIIVFDQILADPDTLLIAFEKPFENSLNNHLAKYLAISSTLMIRENLNVYFNLKEGYEKKSDEWIIKQKKGALILAPRTLTASVTE